MLPRDAAKREAIMVRLREERLARQAEQHERARQLGLKWDGCRFLTGAKLGDDGFEEQKDAADCFFAIQANPEERAIHYQWLPSDQYVIVGWSAIVIRVSPQKKGKSIELLVRPTLGTREGNRPAFTPYRLKETWKMDEQRKLTCEVIEIDDGSNVVCEGANKRIPNVKLVFVD